MDALHCRPVNRNAARVIKDGVNYSLSHKANVLYQRTPLPTQKPSKEQLNHSNFFDLTGERRGRLTVLGQLLGNARWWVCRCDCGNYTLRRAKAVKNKNNEQDRCDECRHLAYMKREEHFRRTGKNRDIKEF